MVVVEALAAGVPVIVSDHAGASAVIREEVNGWVAPAGNEDALFQLTRDLVCLYWKRKRWVVLSS